MTHILFRRHKFHQSCFKRLEFIFRILDPGLVPNFSNCETAGIGVDRLKSVNKVLCGVKCLDLTNKCIKILGAHMIKSSKTIIFS